MHTYVEKGKKIKNKKREEEKRYFYNMNEV